MVKMKSLECPNCGGKVDKPEDKEFFFCLHCGAKIILDDEIKKIHIQKDIMHKQNVIYCEYCGRGIKINYEETYKCPKCKGIFCDDCYIISERSCSRCLVCEICNKIGGIYRCRHCGKIHCSSCHSSIANACLNCAICEDCNEECYTYKCKNCGRLVCSNEYIGQLCWPDPLKLDYLEY